MNLEAARELIDRFLASLYERQDLHEHLACYHPEAWVLLGASVTRRAELTPEAYEETMGTLFGLALPGAGGPPARFEILEPTGWVEDAAEAMLRLAMRDVTIDRSFEAVFHLRLHQQHWHFAGCTLLDPRGPAPNLATLPAFTAAEVAQVTLVPNPGELLLTPLDLAYRRAFPRETHHLLALPETRFSCQNSGQCCQSTMDIYVPGPARLALEGVDWPRVQPGVGAGPFFQEATASDAAEPHQIANREGGCPFHVGQRCAIHQTVGHAPMPVCAIYPIGFTSTPTGVCLWTYFTCPTVRQNLGDPLLERQADMEARVQLWRHAMVEIPEQVPVADAATTLPYAQYEAFEAALLASLADPERSARERVLRAADAVDRLRGQPQLTSEHALEWVAAAQLPAGDPLASEDGIEPVGVALYLVLARYLPWVLAAGGFRDADPLRLPAVLAAAPVRYEPDPELLTRYLRQVLFRKRYLAQVGVVGHVHLLCWIEALVRHAAIAQAVAEDRPATNERDLHQAIAAVERTAFNSALLVQGVIARPEFFQVLLAPGGGITR